jgi:hypothetical protein
MRGRPGREASRSPTSPSAPNWPRHLRTVFTLTPSSLAIAALEAPLAVASTIRARLAARTSALTEPAIRSNLPQITSSNVTCTASTRAIPPTLRQLELR